MILNPLTYWRLRAVCREQARKYGMVREYRLALGLLGDPIEALREWDLIDQEFAMKIQAEYNSQIDIELPPPPETDA